MKTTFFISFASNAGGWEKTMILRSFIIASVLCFPFQLVDICVAKQYKAKVVKIIDGDSIKVEKGKSAKEIRLYGIDCPEYDQPFSIESRSFTKRKILGKFVWIEPVAQDKYGRTVAIVRNSKGVVNYQLVQNGLAWVYPQFCKKRICREWKKAESRAKKSRVGVWSSQEQLPPWVWKRMKRSRD